MNPFPDLAPDDYDALLEDIEKRGMVMPIVLDQDGGVIDGHQRQRIAVTLGIDPPTKVVHVEDDAEREALAIALNIHRRQLTVAQKREYILRLRPTETGLAQHEIAKAVGVSQSTVHRVLHQAADEGVIQMNNTPLPPTRTQVDAGLRSPVDKRGGRPSNAKRPEEKRMHIKPKFGGSPPWLRQFTSWVRRVQPEEKKWLLKMRDEIDQAIKDLDAREETING